MARPRKSSFYHTRWNTVRVNEETAAKILGVDEIQIKEWDKSGAPTCAEKCLLLWDKKNVHADGWDGWLFSRGALVHKGRRWRPENLLEMSNRESIIYEQECELRRLKSWRGVALLIYKLLV